MRGRGEGRREAPHRAARWRPRGVAARRGSSDRPPRRRRGGDAAASRAQAGRAAAARHAPSRAAPRPTSCTVHTGRAAPRVPRARSRRRGIRAARAWGPVLP
eukprot:scaffold100031_cov72-Phaeocystis_antarctica.AAC.1